MKRWRNKLVERASRDAPWWIDEVLGDTLWSKQKEIAAAITKHRRVAVPASFGVGKSYIAGRLAVWFLYTHRPCRVITTSTTQRQVRHILWNEIRTAHQQSRYPLGGECALQHMEIDAQQTAIGFAAKESAATGIDVFTGFHSPNQIIIFDQASGIPTTFWNAALTLMVSEGCRWLAIGNTAIPDGAFADICIDGRQHKYGSWHIIPITSHDSPNVIAGYEKIKGLVTRDWVDDQLANLGVDDPLYKIFVLAQFVEAASMVVVPPQAHADMWNNPGTMGSTFEIGLDVAREGLDKTSWFVRSGSRALYAKTVTGHDTMTVVGETIQLRKKFERELRMQCDAIKVDVIGVGSGVFDRLVELDEPAIEVNNSRGAADPERYKNIRAEMAWTFRERASAEEVGLAMLRSPEPDYIPLLKEEIRAQRYKITSEGLIQIVEKKEISSTLGRSPDRWDSMVNAYEFPHGDDPLSFIQSDGSGNTTTGEYDEERIEAIAEGAEEDLPDSPFDPRVVWDEH